MKSTPKTMLLSLTGAAMVAGATLGAVNMATEEPIADARRNARTEAMEAILPPFDNDITATAVENDGITVFTAEKDGRPAGMAVETYSDAGFGGRIRILAGFDCNGVLTGYRVLEHAETPGLGAKMDTWFMAEGTGHNVIGTEGPVKVKADGGDIDAITGATITSRAFAEAINRARNAVESYKTRRQ